MSFAGSPHDVDGLSISGVDLNELAQISDLTLRRHGPSAAGAGWSSAESQELRFEVLVRAAGLRRSTPFSVNDLGCGYGALFEYLTRQGFDVSRYYGYDICDAMLRAGEDRVDAAHASFVRSPLLTHTADFSFLSGPLNLKAASDEAWTSYARSIILNLASRSRSGFAFNMMTTKVTYRTDALFYADPEEWLAWCRREIDADITLIEDYPLYEWTISGSARRSAVGRS